MELVKFALSSFLPSLRQDAQILTTQEHNQPRPPRPNSHRRRVILHDFDLTNANSSSYLNPDSFHRSLAHVIQVQPAKSNNVLK